MPVEWRCPICAYLGSPAATHCPMCEVPLAAGQGQWSPVRRSPRIPLPPGVWGEANARFAVRLVDLSAHGARLEHRQALRPGHLYSLTLPVVPAAGSCRVRARVVWSQVHRFEPGAGVIYHSGLEFQDLPQEVEGELAAYLAAAGEARSTSRAASPASPSAVA